MKNLCLLSFLIFSINAHAQVDTFIKMTDQDLFNAALAGKVGKCQIFDSRSNSSNFCDYYAKAQDAAGAYVGLPDAYGSGCLVAPSAPKRVGVCWGSPNTYDQYNQSSTPICTPDHIKNGANMIRIGLMKGLCGIPKVVESTRKCELKEIDYYDEELTTIFSSVLINSEASSKLGLKEGRYQMRQHRRNYNNNGKKCLDSGAIILDIAKKSSAPSPVDRWSFSLIDESKGYSNSSGMRSVSKDVFGNSLEVAVEFGQAVGGRYPLCKILKSRLNGVKVGLQLKSLTTNEPWDCENVDADVGSSQNTGSQPVCAASSNDEVAKLNAKLDSQEKNFQKERDEFNKAKSKVESEKKLMAEQLEKQKNEMNIKLENQKKDFAKEKESLVKDQKRLQAEVDKMKAELEKAKNEKSKSDYVQQRLGEVRRMVK